MPLKNKEIESGLQQKKEVKKPIVDSQIFRFFKIKAYSNDSSKEEMEKINDAVNDAILFLEKREENEGGEDFTDPEIFRLLKIIIFRKKFDYQIEQRLYKIIDCIILSYSEYIKILKLK